MRSKLTEPIFGGRDRRPRISRVTEESEGGERGIEARMVPEGERRNARAAWGWGWELAGGG